ncbi:MAG TPA: protein kinase [Myxococcales bacterium]|nr:protein kinase [Myxococcales bacterium]
MRPGGDRPLSGEERSAPEPGPRILAGRYRVEVELGRGGMGRVVRGRDLKIGRAVAIKLLKCCTGDLERRRRFEREARAAGALNHPNILNVFDVGEDDDEPYIVTELLEGETLRAALSRSILPVEDVQDLCLQLVDALAAAHAKGIVHRDLKPENLFLMADGRLKVLDFGIAKLVEAGDGLPNTAPGTIFGTPAYMSPEQIQGRPADARSDVFSIGLVLHEMLSGSTPFGGKNSTEIAYSIVRDPPKPLPSSAPKQLAQAVARCLQKDPAARYANASQLLRAIQGDRGDARRRRPVASRRGRRMLISGAVALALVLGLPLAWYGAIRGRIGGKSWQSAGLLPSIAVLPFVDMSPEKNQEYFSDGLAEEIINSLAQLSGLRVAGRTSSFSFKGKNENLRSIGRQLGVGHVLEGSVRKQGNRVRITAQVISVADGFHVWSQTYDRAFADVFAVQDEIGRSVAQALKIRLLARASRPRAEEASPDSYNLFLAARQLHNTGTKEGCRRASETYRKALELAPGYAPAWASLAFARYAWAYSFAETPAAARKARDEAFAAAEKAITLDPRGARGYSARGHLKAAERSDWTGAQADFERALAISPGETSALEGIATVFATIGRLQEAIAVQRRLAELEPLIPRVHATLGFLHTAASEFPEARQAFDHALEIAPDLPDGSFGAGVLFLLEGRSEAALEMFGKCKVESLELTGQALALESLGRVADSEGALEVLTERFGGSAAYAIAQVHAWRGNRDEAFPWLDRAREQHDPRLASVKYDPLLRNLRGDPRRAAFLQKMNLPLD